MNFSGSGSQSWDHSFVRTLLKVRHCVRNVLTRSYSGILNNSEYGHFLRSRNYKDSHVNTKEGI